MLADGIRLSLAALFASGYCFFLLLVLLICKFEFRVFIFLVWSSGLFETNRLYSLQNVITKRNCFDCL